MMKLMAIATMTGLGIAVSGCATVVRGTSQTIAIGSTPDGAACVFSRDGQTLAAVTTPGSITVRRDRKPIDVACTKEGYEEGRGVMNSRSDSSYYPVPLFGLISLAGQLTDMATGANNRFETSLMMTLEPLSAADRAAGATGKVTTSAATAPVGVPVRPSAPPPASTAAATPPAASAAPATPPPFQTGAWSTRSLLIADRSAGNCVRDAGIYTLDLTGDMLTVDNINGRMLTATVPADGRIEQAFRSPSGARLTIVGNARTRELEVVNDAFGCRWKLTPTS